MEWFLTKSIFIKICKRFGTPTVDLFASRLNAQLPKFVLWRPEPRAWLVDAFSISWTFEFSFIFPPFNLMPQVLQKLRKDGGPAIVVAPLWQSQAWFPQLLELTVAPSHIVRLTDNILELKHRPTVQHHLKEKMYLVICRCSSNPLLRREFIRTCGRSLGPPGG